MNKPLIDQMVDRFLGWKLPEDFNPDGGITFNPEFNENTAYPMRHEPSGTNLLTGVQAKEMLGTVCAPALDLLTRCRNALVVMNGRPCDSQHLIADIDAALNSPE